MNDGVIFEPLHNWMFMKTAFIDKHMWLMKIRWWCLIVDNVSDVYRRQWYYFRKNIYIYSILNIIV